MENDGISHDNRSRVRPGILGKIDEDIDLFNLSIFSDLDIEQVQDDRNREIAFRSKLKRLRKKYFEKIEMIHALTNQILLTREFTELKDNAFMTDLTAEVDQLPPNNDTDLNPREEKILNTIQEENTTLLYERNKKLIENFNHVPPKNNIVLKPKSCYQSFRKSIITFLYYFACFKKDFALLSTVSNYTLIILFQILRLILIMSIISVFIFVYLIVIHFLTHKDSLSSLCKYNFPCILLYSYHDLTEGLAYSITIGVWISFMFLCGIIYFFLTLTETQEKQLFLRKESIISQFVFTSWNFNVRSENLFNYYRDGIYDKCKEYLSEEKHHLKIKSDKCSCSTSACGRYMMRFLSWTLFIILILVFTFVLLFVFLFRSSIKDKTVNKQTFAIMDYISEISFYLLIPILLIFFPFVASFFPEMEMFSSKSVRNKHVIIKYFITHCWGLVVLIFVQSYFNLWGKTLNDLIPGFNLVGFETFGCSGKYTLNTNQSDQVNYTTLPLFTYPQCREEDTGINFLFISVSYFIIYICKDFFTSCCVGCCSKIVYQPYENLIAIFTMFILFSITVFFIPFFIILLPLLAVIMFEYQLFKIKKLTKGFCNIYNSINERNKSMEMLFTFLACLIWLTGTLLFFYLSAFPHAYFSIVSILLIYLFILKCMGNATENAMFLSDTLLCGPIPSKIKMSEIMTNDISSTFLISGIYQVLSEPTLIMILLSALISAFVYWRFNVGMYRNYTIKRQNEMINSLHLSIEHLVKRDVITSLLLKMSKKKER